MDNIPKVIVDHLLSECGIIEVLLVMAVSYLATQLAKTRTAWEADRSGMVKLMQSQSSSYEKLAVSHAKLEGILLALRGKR